MHGCRPCWFWNFSGLREPSCSNAFFSSCLVRRPSPSASFFLKTSFSCPVVRGTLADFGTK
ncbi:hypothetical protein Patl1_08970 [Pistacia atlantica]|uniref:Uncharacterized protein n=1 Tax=Pistacia atlantica TaxID=434234 RepID=A0ACC1AGX7_9ROSI|nr:hypothetical protein Patl1_08970 [Pistacia atlantica]